MKPQRPLLHPVARTGALLRARRRRRRRASHHPRKRLLRRQRRRPAPPPAARRASAHRRLRRKRLAAAADPPAVCAQASSARALPICHGSIFYGSAPFCRSSSEVLSEGRSVFQGFLLVAWHVLSMKSATRQGRQEWVSWEGCMFGGCTDSLALLGSCGFIYGLDTLSFRRLQHRCCQAAQALLMA